VNKVEKMFLRNIWRYQRGIQKSVQLFQRSRLKYVKVNGRTTDAKWWQYLTWPFGSGELKKLFPVYKINREQSWKNVSKEHLKIPKRYSEAVVCENCLKDYIFFYDKGPLEFIPVIVKNKTFWILAAHVKVTFSLFLERLSKLYESFQCFLHVNNL
jgi:hypothetical protein